MSWKYIKQNYIPTPLFKQKAENIASFASLGIQTSAEKDLQQQRDAV